MVSLLLLDGVAAAQQSLPFRTSLPYSAACRQEKTRQNGRKMTSFRGATAKLGACVDNELGGSAPHQCT